jgi:aspartyl-tRNA(Asn)/glutamyl-tRNA(Gln) amidotransferase subunit A
MAALGTAVEISKGVRAGRLRAVEVCKQALERIEALDPALRAFVETVPDYALARAGRVDAAVAAGEAVGPLAGVPIAVKDNLCTTFARTTCGSRILEDYLPPYDATVVERIEASGGVIVGKTNMDEFGMGSSTEASAFFPTRNPWSAAHVPGGSSGGSAAAVSSGMVPLALGSDTGGSIRQPAAFCGLVGLKPTYGLVSRYGLVAYGSSLDQVGPLARDVADAARLLSVLAGHDARDSTSVSRRVPDYGGALAAGRLERVRRRVRIGVAEEYFAQGLEAETQAAVEGALEVYRGLGMQAVAVSLPRIPEAIAAYYLIVTAECSSNLARYDGVRYGRRSVGVEDIGSLYTRSRSEGFGAEVKRRIMLGTYALSAGYHDAYYRKAQRVRRLIKEDFERALAQCEVLLGPVSPTPPFCLGEKLDDPLAMYLMDVYTVGLNLSGLPGVAVPCGLTAAGLPIGMQLMGRAFDEVTLLQVAELFQRETDWHTKRPPSG